MAEFNYATYRQEIIENLKPIVDAFHVDFDYVYDAKRQYIVCNNQKICVSDTSIEGIRAELVGYIFLMVWRKRYLGAFDKQTRNYIKQYWYDDNFNQPFLKW